MSRGRPGTGTGSGGRSAETSISRTAPIPIASTQAVCGKVTERSSGLMWNRSDTSARLGSLFGRRKVRVASGEAKIARLLACSAQKPSSSISSVTASSIGQIARFSTPPASIWATAAFSRFFSSIRSAAASCVTGVVAR